jgi:hypothetical protein
VPSVVSASLAHRESGLFLGRRQMSSRSTSSNADGLMLPMGNVRRGGGRLLSNFTSRRTERRSMKARRGERARFVKSGSMGFEAGLRQHT